MGSQTKVITRRNNIFLQHSHQTMAALKRLKKDLQCLQKEPLIGCNAIPSESDFTLWDGVIMVDFTIDNKIETVPFHFVIDFPDTYPMTAPNVGFSVPFSYKMGANYIMRDQKSRLNGKLILCLDLLGNFADVHREWS